MDLYRSWLGPGSKFGPGTAGVLFSVVILLALLVLMPPALWLIRHVVEPPLDWWWQLWLAK